jgi:hypothetical protein
MSTYNPRSWYWLATDGRVYSSQQQAVIPDTDQGYLDWIAAGNTPSTWPADDQGNQTDWAMQQVLAPYIIPVDLKSYARLTRDTVIVSGCTITGVAGMTEIATDPYSQNVVGSYHSFAAADPAFAVAWVMPDRSTVLLANADIISVYDQEQAFFKEQYDTYTQVIGDIDGGSITTTDEIDLAFGLAKERQRVALGWSG